MRYLHLILNFSDGSKSIAIYERVPLNQNLLFLHERYAKIYDGTTGDVAVLNIIHACETKQLAVDTCEAWNKTYKQENRYFGG